MLQYVSDRLELDERLSDLWVVGEVANYSRSQQGHRYFTLKDDYGALRCVLFRTEMPGLELESGSQLITHGRLAVYRQRGELQYVCDFVRPAGVGIAAARFEELRERLERDGLFAAERKRPLPRFPMRIGVVTSPTGAAIEDIQRVVARRWPMAELVLSPTVVQGETSAIRIAAALDDLAREEGLEVAILARGGGSAEDLWGFNDERVARALFRFPVPVVTGIGHATDVTIADLVADEHAPTPSVAAERCTPNSVDLIASFAAWRTRATVALRQRIGGHAENVQALVRRLRREGPDPSAEAQALLARARAMQQRVERQMTEQQAALEATARRVEVLDPMATLRRGFAIVQDAGTKRVVRSARKAKPGQRLTIAVEDGAFWAEVS